MAPVIIDLEGSDPLRDIAIGVHARSYFGQLGKSISRSPVLFQLKRETTSHDFPTYLIELHDENADDGGLLLHFLEAHALPDSDTFVEESEYAFEEFNMTVVRDTFLLKLADLYVLGLKYELPCLQQAIITKFEESIDKGQMSYAVMTDIKYQINAFARERAEYGPFEDFINSNLQICRKKRAETWESSEKTLERKIRARPINDTPVSLCSN
ncbi:hypothetical protein MMC25_004035 [Agyrium rufum]|nr:hypothetical protein [Agyrium rufum]